MASGNDDSLVDQPAELVAGNSDRQYPNLHESFQVLSMQREQTAPPSDEVADGDDSRNGQRNEDSFEILSIQREPGLEIAANNVPVAPSSADVSDNQIGQEQVHLNGGPVNHGDDNLPSLNGLPNEIFSEFGQQPVSVGALQVLSEFEVPIVAIVNQIAANNVQDDAPVASVQPVQPNNLPSTPGLGYAADSIDGPAVELNHEQIQPQPENVVPEPQIIQSADAAEESDHFPIAEPSIREVSPVLEDGIYGKLIVLGENGVKGGPNEFFLRRRAVANGLCETGEVPLGDGASADRAPRSLRPAFDTSFGRIQAAQVRHDVNLNQPLSEGQAAEASHHLAQSEMLPRVFQYPIHRAGEEDTSHHSQILFKLSRNETQMVQFKMDPKLDMFQVGRAQSSQIDMRVDQRVPEADGSSMTSRYSCRIVVKREYPHEARIYAAGFDDSYRIFLGEIAKVWKLPNGHVDGLTTNGVLICKDPANAVSSGVPNQSAHWREVSVRGNIYPYRMSRNISEFEVISEEDNILRDGTLIDLAGIVLMWRSRVGLTEMLNDHRISELRKNLDVLNGQAICPVLYHPLLLKPSVGPPAPGHVLQSSMMPRAVDLGPVVHPGQAALAAAAEEQAAFTSDIPSDQLPVVYVSCGHVSSNVDWGRSYDDAITYQCPVCRTEGLRLRLRVGAEPCFWRDLHPTVTHAFTKCAHGVSEETASFWSKLHLPRDLTAICPFCGLQVDKFQPYTKLYFQSQDPGLASSDQAQEQQHHENNENNSNGRTPEFHEENGGNE